MGVPRVYRTGGEAAIASYNYVDIANGLGIVTFFGGSLGLSGTTKYILSPDEFYSNKVFTHAIDITPSTNQLYQSLDFDARFNLPRLIKGDVIVNVPVLLRNYGGVGTISGTAYTIATLSRLDSLGNETIISSGAGTRIQVSIAQTANAEKMFTNVIALSGAQKFNKGESLRITTDVYAGASISNQTLGVHVGHDPKNRLEDPEHPDVVWTAPTIMSVQVPFVVDL